MRAEREGRWRLASAGMFSSVRGRSVRTIMSSSLYCLRMKDRKTFLNENTETKGWREGEERRGGREEGVECVHAFSELSVRLLGLLALQ